MQLLGRDGRKLKIRGYKLNGETIIRVDFSVWHVILSKLYITIVILVFVLLLERHHKN